MLSLILMYLSAHVYYNAMESTAVTAQQQDPTLQQVRTCSDATAVGREIIERSLLCSEGHR